MQNTELSDWLFLGGPVVGIVAMLVVLKISYSMKSFQPLASEKPRFCLLPKYVVQLPVEGQDIEGALSSRLAFCGFRQIRNSPNEIAFTRGSELGDFSIKITKLTATTSRPVSNPVQLNVKYGAAFGCAFDTGDLWKFCQELTEKVEVAVIPAVSHRPRSTNPYQPPQH